VSFFCAERACERFIRTNIGVDERAALQSRITYLPTDDDDSAIHLVLVDESRFGATEDKWATCVSRGTEVVKGRFLSPDEARRFASDRPDSDDL
jgi:hypothetical protein